MPRRPWIDQGVGQNTQVWTKGGGERIEKKEEKKGKKRPAENELSGRPRNPSPKVKVTSDMQWGAIKFKQPNSNLISTSKKKPKAKTSGGLAQPVGVLQKQKQGDISNYLIGRQTQPVDRGKDELTPGSEDPN